MNFEVLYALFLLGLTGAVAVAYGIRITLKGQAHFDRVERQGGSNFLSKGLMEAGYWFFQFIAKFLILCRCSANQISWGSLFFGFLAGCCLAFGHFGSGAIFAALSGVMDSLDGMVARMTGQSSDAGEVLDAAVDRYVEFFFLGGLLIYYREIPIFMIVVLLALIGSFMVSYSTAKAEALNIEPPRGSMRRTERAVYLALGAALSPITISWFEVSRDYPVPIAHPMVAALGLVAVMANFSAVERFLAIARAVRKKARKLS
jgi:phosphatidylglycerophosphate synthase